mmetsp:Transcript_6358/g.23285  ORF Transcript_6358/g.23285 Transcript_6358/m.23285 type:complete len:276 (+) Transcript_6358:879-1706(+)
MAPARILARHSSAIGKSIMMSSRLSSTALTPSMIDPGDAGPSTLVGSARNSFAAASQSMFLRSNPDVMNDSTNVGTRRSNSAQDFIVFTASATSLSSKKYSIITFDSVSNSSSDIGSVAAGRGVGEGSSTRVAPSGVDTRTSADAPPPRSRSPLGTSGNAPRCSRSLPPPRGKSLAPLPRARSSLRSVGGPPRRSSPRRFTSPLPISTGGVVLPPRSPPPTRDRSSLLPRSRSPLGSSRLPPPPPLRSSLRSSLRSPPPRGPPRAAFAASLAASL